MKRLLPFNLPSIRGCNVVYYSRVVAVSHMNPTTQCLSAYSYKDSLITNG